MSSGERAPLCGYINKPSFSIVIIIFLSIIYIFYITIQLHTWLSITLVSELIGPYPPPQKKKKPTTIS
jgi:hypothetical protein